MFYKEHLLFIKRIGIACLDEFIAGLIKIKYSKYFATCVYHSSNQTENEIYIFISGFEQVFYGIALESLFCSVILGD